MNPTHNRQNKNQEDEIKNYLVKEQRDEERICYWINRDSFQEVDQSINMAWHPTWIVGDINEDDYKMFLKLCLDHNKDKNHECLYMFDNANVDKFLNQLELKAQANSLKNRLNEAQTELDEVENKLKSISE